MLTGFGQERCQHEPALSPHRSGSDSTTFRHSQGNQLRASEKYCRASSCTILTSDGRGTAAHEEQLWVEYWVDAYSDNRCVGLPLRRAIGRMGVGRCDIAQRIPHERGRSRTAKWEDERLSEQLCTQEFSAKCEVDQQVCSGIRPLPSGLSYR
jgi:hypothetical protein